MLHWINNWLDITYSFYSLQTPIYNLEPLKQHFKKQCQYKRPLLIPGRLLWSHTANGITTSKLVWIFIFGCKMMICQKDNSLPNQNSVFIVNSSHPTFYTRIDKDILCTLAAKNSRGSHTGLKCQRINSVLLNKIIGTTKIKEIKWQKYLLEKNATFRSLTGMLQALIMLIDLVITNKLRVGRRDLGKYKLKTAKSN